MDFSDRTREVGLSLGCRFSDVVGPSRVASPLGPGLGFRFKGDTDEGQTGNQEGDGRRSRNLKCLWLVKGSHEWTEFCDVLPRPIFKRWMHHGDDAQKEENKPQNESQTPHEETL